MMLADSDQTLILGVDPGLSGGLATFCIRSQKLVEVIDMPVTQNSLEGSEYGGKRASTQLEPYLISAFIDKYARRTLFATIEDVGAMTYMTTRGEIRGQGAAGSFAFGKAHGIVIGVLAAYMIPMRFVKPAGWKISMGLTANKSASRHRAAALFPDHEKSFRRVKDDGRAEAALIAYFGARGVAFQSRLASS